VSEGETPQGRFAALARADERGAVVTVLEGPGLGSKLLVLPDGTRSGSLGSPELDDEGARHAEELMWAERSEKRGPLFIDVTFPAPRLIIFGAIDFAAQLCTLARVSGWVPYVSDPRGFFARKDRFPDAEEVFVGWPDKTFEALGGIDRAMSIAVLTHDPKLDDAALEIALRSDAAYVGAMGSHRAQAKRRDRLHAKGITDEELARLSAPIGLDLGALTPEETALSIMSEIVALRRGRPGGRLANARGRIHEVTGEAGEVKA
jgi:xanthine dehydrogenase accessory factor